MAKFDELDTIYARKRPLPEPTQERPGTPAKIRVMRQRIARGEMLYHPDDAKITDGGGASESENKNQSGAATTTEGNADVGKPVTAVAEACVDDE